MNTRIIALVNQKGGTGKTTSTINLGAGLARRGRRVMLVDLDPQASLTYSLGLEVKDGRPTIYEVLCGKATAAQATITREGRNGGPRYDVLPATLDLEAAELELAPEMGRELFLKEALEPIAAGYDYIIIDAPPRLTILALNALAAANELFIPLQAEVLPLKGMRALTNTVDLIRRRLNPRINITGVIVTRYSGRRTLGREVVDAINDLYGAAVFNTRIRENVSLAEAPGFGMDIYEYKPGSNGALDYATLSEEVLAQEGGRDK